MSFKRSALLLLMVLPLLLFPGCSPEAGLSEEETLPLNGDIIVLGGGIAGLTAALEAARHGASVILCYDELQDDRWMWGGGALGTGEDRDIAGLEKALQDYGEGEGQGWHYKLLSRHADGSLAWLIRETGLKVAASEGFRYLPENISYTQAQSRLASKALGEGVRIIKGVLVEGLLISDAGKAAGIKFIDSNGLKHTAYAPAVIIADGGYLNDLERIKQINPGITVASWRGSGEGEGIKLARAAGLDLVNEGQFSYVLAIEEEQSWVEVIPPPGTVLIVDDQVYPFLQQAGAGLAGSILNSAAGKGYLLVAEAGLGPEHELNWPRYPGINAFLEAYQLELPSLYRRFSRPQGYFYGCPVKAVAAYCLGGIAVDESGTVLREGRPVEGLYAIGEAAGGLNGAALMPGTALTEALVWGRRIGEAAARYAQE